LAVAFFRPVIMEKKSQTEKMEKKSCLLANLYPEALNLKRMQQT
jgi:hypothetical protein